MKEKRSYDPSLRSRNAIERIDKMAKLKQEPTDRERLQKKGCKSPCLKEMIFRASNHSMKLTYFFTSEKRLRAFMQNHDGFEVEKIFAG